MAGTQYCRITPGGDVTPCPYMTVVAGNVREQSFAEIWTSSPVLTDLRDPSRLKGTCGACEFKELCGGCRCRAQAAFEDYLAEDPACLYQPTGRALERYDIEWSPEAQKRLDRIPISFIRDKVRKGLEAYADRHGVRRISTGVMQEALAGMDRGAPSFSEPVKKPLDSGVIKEPTIPERLV